MAEPAPAVTTWLRPLSPRGQRGVLIRLLRPFLRPYTRWLAAVVALFAIQAGGNLYLPSLNAHLIDDGITAGDTGYILSRGLIMMIVTGAQCVIALIALYWAARTSAAVGRDMRAAVFARIQSFAVADLHRFGTPSLVTRSTNDVQQIQLFLQLALTLLVIAPIIWAGGLVMAVLLNSQLSVLPLVAVPVMAAGTAGLLARATARFRRMQAALDRVSEVLREQITGVRVIRAFARGPAERQRFAAANDHLSWLALRMNRIAAAAMPALSAVLNLACVAVLWFGGRLAGRGELPVGDLTAYGSYTLQVLMSVMMALTMAILAPRAAASAERVSQVLAAEPSVTRPAGPVTPAARAGAVEFREVCCRYPGRTRPVLREVTFAVRPGSTTAVIGGTGSGKTTLLGLILRLADVSAGRVLVDGTDVRRQDLDELRAGIGLVPQRAFLFAASVADNLRLGRPGATDHELWRALRVAQASEFVAALPGRLDAAVDIGGASLAGGQQQRLVIARAVLRAPRLYLFDDCFTALDGVTSARLRAALATATAGATVVLATQRVAEAAAADQIVVLVDGQVAGLGRHAALLRGCPAYREIVASQLGEDAVRC